jgi:CheY-like chemotaxis protein
VPASVLLVGHLPDLPGALRAAGREAALRLLDKSIDAIVVQLHLPGGGALELLRECALRLPHAPRILLAGYDDLPSLLSARGSGLFSRVLDSEADAGRIARAVEEALHPAEEVSVSTARGPSLEALLRTTAACLAQTRGAMIRPLPPDSRALQLQFVLPQGRRIDSLREEIVRLWLWPIKPRDGRVEREHRQSPAGKLAAGFSRRSEAYAKHFPGFDAYLLLLPWQREAKLTAALGIAGSAPAGQWPLLKAIHAGAISELAEFALPSIEETSGVGQAVPEYDWIVTPDYAGPDRRQRPTGLFTRFLFFGRRRRVPSRIARVSGSFSDGAGPGIAKYAVLYLLLAALDAWLTLRCVRAGLVREANPLLRPLVQHHEWLFLACKNALALGAFALVARFQLFRLGRPALRAMAALYLLLDLYWALLLLRL